MNIQIETTNQQFRDKIAELLRDEPIDTDVARSIVNRIGNIAEAFFEVPEGITEIRATVKSYAVDADDEKAIKITMAAHNNQPNRVKLACVGDATVTIRTLQGDIESPSNEQ